MVVVHRYQDCKARDANTDWKDGEQEAVLEPVREPRN